MIPKHPKASEYVRSNFFKRIRSFDQLEKKIISAFPIAGKGKNERGMAFEVFVEAWLNVVRKGTNILPSNAIRPTLHKKLKLVGKSTLEKGWDGVFSDLSGEYAVYQAKFRSGQNQLTYSDLKSTFAATKKCPYPVCVITNLDRVTPDYDNQNYFLIGKSEFRRLKEADFTAIEKWLQGVKPKPVEFTRRRYQKKVIKSVIDEFKKADRTQAIMACGTGKTLVTKWINDDLKSKRTLVLLPSLALLRQTFREWSIASSLKDTAYIAVCSQKSITKGLDELVFRTTELEFPVKNNAKELRSLFRKYDKKKKVVIFSTYDSSEIVGRASSRLYPFDLGVFDEAHKTAAKWETKFSYALKNKNIKIVKRLFVTATPRVVNVLAEKKDGEFDVSSMDDPAVYGEVCYRMSFPEAVKLGVICDYKIIISVLTQKEVDRALLKKAEVIRKKDIIRAQQVAHQLALKDAIRRFNLKKIFSFHGSISAAKSFIGEGPEGIKEHVKDLQCFHVNGRKPANEREAILEDFAQSKRGLVSNARCLCEGVNLPSVDCSAFIDPRRSEVDIVQATGRAMRTDPGNPKKKRGYIFIPLYVEQKVGESAEEAAERSDYSTIISVLSAMSDNDEDFKEIITAMGVERGLKIKGVIRGKMFAGKVAAIGPTVGLKRLANAILTKVADKLIINWDMMFGLLLRYKKENGHLDIKDGEIYNSRPLGDWLTNQRVLYNGGRLSSSRFERLDEIEVVWDVREMNWEVAYMIMQQVVLDTGRPYVKDDEIIDGIQIGSWCGVQRRESKQHIDKAKKNKSHKKSEAYKLRMERDRRLENLCPGKWWWNPEDDKYYDQLYIIKQQLKKFPNRQIPRDLELIDTNYESFQKHLFKYKNAKHAKWEKVKNIPEFESYLKSRSKDTRFLSKVDLLEDYEKVNGNYNVPRNHKVGSVNLGEWFKDLRRTLLGNSSNSPIKINLDRLKYLEGVISEISDKPYSYFTKKFKDN